MSRLVAFAAIQGGYNIVSQVEGEYQKALDTFNADTQVGFPNTAYYLPVIYSLLGIKVETLEDIQQVLEVCRKLLPPHIKGMNHLPYLGPLLDAGMATLFSFEIREALRYLNEPDFYLHYFPGGRPQQHFGGPAASGSQRSDRLEYAHRALRALYFFGYFRPGVCQPRGHGLW